MAGENGSSEALDSLWIPSSFSTFNGSSSMVNFENGCGLSQREEACEDDYDGCFLRQGKKRRLSGDQVQFLEKSFEAENRLEPERKVRLAKELGLQPRQVAIWFQNRRARSKTKQLEIDYESLRSSFDELKSDYDDLVKETEKLKEEVLFLKDKLLIADQEHLPKIVSENGSDSDVAPSSAKSDVLDSDSPLVDSSNVFESEEDGDNNNFDRSFLPVPALPSCLSELGDGHFQHPHHVGDQIFCCWP